MVVSKSQVTSFLAAVVCVAVALADDVVLNERKTIQNASLFRCVNYSLV